MTQYTEQAYQDKLGPLQPEDLDAALRSIRFNFVSLDNGVDVGKSEVFGALVKLGRTAEQSKTFGIKAYISKRELAAQTQKVLPKKICPECGNAFVPKRKGQVYDKRACAARVGERRRRKEKKSLHQKTLTSDAAPVKI
jgi:hypothetical protein